jgi:hypothetical protein
MNNINISFFHDARTYYNNGFTGRRGLASEKI